MNFRRTAAEQMIELDMVKWLVSIMSDVETLSEYSLEYASALLMNLSLR